MAERAEIHRDVQAQTVVAAAARDAQTERGGKAPLFFFSSSVAVFGSDPGLPLPPVVDDRTLPTPQSSYGIHKFMCEQLVADYTRKGYIDGRCARLMTVSVRPGRPNGAASSGRTALNLPALTVTVREMLDALAAQDGAATAQRVRFERDAAIERIVGGWPARFKSARAEHLGLKADTDYSSVIAQYMRDHALGTAS